MRRPLPLVRFAVVVLAATAGLSLAACDNADCDDDDAGAASFSVPLDDHLFQPARGGGRSGGRSRGGHAGGGHIDDCD